MRIQWSETDRERRAGRTLRDKLTLLCGLGRHLRIPVDSVQRPEFSLSPGVYSPVAQSRDGNRSLPPNKILVNKQAPRQHISPRGWKSTRPSVGNQGKGGNSAGEGVEGGNEARTRAPISGASC